MQSLWESTVALLQWTSREFQQRQEVWDTEAMPDGILNDSFIFSQVLNQGSLHKTVSNKSVPAAGRLTGKPV